MYTKVKDKKTGIITGYRTQQYSIGTYCIIDDDPSKQLSLNETEEEIHKTIRGDSKLEVIEQY